MDPLGGGFYRIQVDLDPAGIQSGLRTLAELDFGTTVLGRSSIADVQVSGLVGVRLGGDVLANATPLHGRVFVIEDEPLLDAEGFSGPILRLVAYAQPGTTLRLQRLAQFDGVEIWTDVQTLNLPGTFQSYDWSTDQSPASYFRLTSP
jgi:hypothetical protein